MKRPICVKCKVQMRPAKTGVDVELMTGAEPYQIWMGDLFRCPGCNIEIVTGFGGAPVAEHFQQKYASFVPCIFTRFWQSLEDKAA